MLASVFADAALASVVVVAAEPGGGTETRYPPGPPQFTSGTNALLTTNPVTRALRGWHRGATSAEICRGAEVFVAALANDAAELCKSAAARPAMTIAGRISALPPKLVPIRDVRGS